MKRSLLPRQRKFAELCSADVPPIDAYHQAGYQPHPDEAESLADELLRSPVVNAEVEELRQLNGEQDRSTFRDQIYEVLKPIALAPPDDPKVTPAQRHSAIREIERWYRNMDPEEIKQRQENRRQKTIEIYSSQFGPQALTSFVKELPEEAQKRFCEHYGVVPISDSVSN